MNTVMIIGVTGQDGTYLARQLLAQGHRVIGVTRSAEKARLSLTVSPDDRLILEQWGFAAQLPIDHLFDKYRPLLAFNLAARSSGAEMHANPVAMSKTNGIAVTHILEAIRTRSPETRFCQASSAEMFGEPVSHPQSEATPFNPRSPYGAAKLYAHSMVGLYRRNYGLHLSSAILFNHESPLRGMDFVTRRVTNTVARIKLGLTGELLVGNLESRRDWGFAGDYVQAMQLMTEAENPEDFVVATGKTHSVEDLCRVAFACVDLDYRDYIGIDKAIYRPTEPVELVGDTQKIDQKLQWQATKTFDQTIRMMVEADLSSEGARLKADSRNHQEQ